MSGHLRRRKGPKNQTRVLLAGVLSDVGDMNATELSTFLGLPIRTTQYNLRRMVELGEAHIVRWHRPDGLGGKHGAVYRVGPGRNVRPPKPTDEEAHLRKIEWQRHRRRDLSLKQKLERRAVSGTLTPFSSIVLQLGGEE